MNRFFFVFAFVLLVGCRMCGSPYDYCVPAHTHRSDDYRGCNVFYRAGSIFWNVGSTDAGADIGFVTDRSVNAGNFGTTTPIESNRPTQRMLEPRKLDRPTIGIPHKSAAPPLNGTEDSQPFNVPAPGEHPVSPPPTGFTPIPFDQTQNQVGPSITIEELRRLDPTVTDVRILNVEDLPSPKTGSQSP